MLGHRHETSLYTMVMTSTSKKKLKHLYIKLIQIQIHSRNVTDDDSWSRRHLSSKLYFEKKSESTWCQRIIILNGRGQMTNCPL